MGDNRVDGAVFFAATEALRFLDNTLPGLSIKHDDAFASKLLLIYFGTRIHGAAAAVPILLTQRLGREAIIMMRCQYDYWLKMLYYDTYHAEADAVIELVDKGAYEYEFQKKAHLDLSYLCEADIQKFDELAKLAKEPNFTTEIVGGLRRDIAFQKAADANDNPFAKWFYANIDSTFAGHWKYGSSIVHASPQDMPKVLVKSPDGSIMINVDSRMKAPNKTIADSAQRCFSAMSLLRWRFGLEYTPEHLEWPALLNGAMVPYLDEATDTYSMHDEVPVSS